jgi:hypothetical protein
MRRKVEWEKQDIVAFALRMPDVLSTLFAVRDGNDAADSAESAASITKVAEQDASVVLPYAAFVVRGIDSPVKQVRWESLATLALLARHDPSLVGPLLSRLRDIIEHDGSVIARDKAIDALVAYGASAPDAARQVLPPLESALDSWSGKHVARILRGFVEIVPVIPEERDRLHVTAMRYADADRPSERTAAKRLLAAMKE